MAGGRHRPPPPVASAGASSASPGDATSSRACLEREDSWDELLSRLHPLEALREAIWTQCNSSGEEFATVFDPSCSGSVSASAFAKGVDALGVNVRELTSCRDAVQVFDTFLDPCGLGVLPLSRLAQRLGGPQLSSSSVSSYSYQSFGSRHSLRDRSRDSDAESANTWSPPRSGAKLFKSASSPGSRASSSSGRRKSPLKDLCNVEKSIAACSDEAHRLRGEIGELQGRARARLGSHSPTRSEPQTHHLARVEGVLARHRTQYAALEAAANAARQEEAAAVCAEKAAQLRLRRRQEMCHSHEARCEEAAAILCQAELASEVNAMAETVAELHNAWLVSDRASRASESAVAQLRERAHVLAEDLPCAEARLAAHSEEVRAMAWKRALARRCLLDEHQCLELELLEESSRHESEVAELEVEISGIEGNTGGPEADVVEATMLLRAEQGHCEAFAREAEALEASRAAALRAGGAEIGELVRELGEQRGLSRERGRRAVAQGERALAAFKGEASEALRISRAADLRAEGEERSARQALVKIARQLENQRARNIGLETAAAQCWKEKDEHACAIEEFGFRVEKLHRVRAALASEVKAERQERSELKKELERRASEDQAAIAGLWATARGLAAEAMAEQNAHVKVLADRDHATDAHARVIADYQERLAKSRTCSDKADKTLLWGLREAEEQLQSKESLRASGCRRLARSEIETALMQHRSEHHLAKFLLAGPVDSK